LVCVGKLCKGVTLLFYKLTDDKGMSVKVFHIISHFLGENCTGLCTDEAQSLSGRNAGLQALLINSLTLSGHTVCFIQALASKNMSTKLQTVLQAAIRVVNSQKGVP